MAKINIPDSVKVLVAGKEPLSTNVDTIPLKFNVGRDEIIVLLQVNVIGNVPSLHTPIHHRWAIWKKSDEEWPQDNLNITDLAKESDIIAGGEYQKTYQALGEQDGVSAAGPGVVGDKVLFPYPVIMIRNPQFLFEPVGSYQTHHIGVICYYLIEKVTNETLARLMVKDHA